MRTVELVAEQAESKALRELLKSVAADVAAGYSLASGFEIRNKTLPATFVETIRAGEESGSLEVSFSRLSEYFSKKSKIRAKTITSLTYPAFVVVVAVIVITVIMVYAVPTFTQTFETMGIHLPWATRFLIAMSDFFSNYILIILAFAALSVLGLRVFYHTDTGHVRLSRLHLNLPVLGRIAAMTAASQFANTLSIMLASGLPVIRALNVTGRAMSNFYLGRSVGNVVASVEAGRRIGEGMEDTNFPELLVEMTKIGERLRLRKRCTSSATITTRRWKAPPRARQTCWSRSSSASSRCSWCWCCWRFTCRCSACTAACNIYVICLFGSRRAVQPAARMNI